MYTGKFFRFTCTYNRQVMAYLFGCIIIIWTEEAFVVYCKRKSKIGVMGTRIRTYHQFVTLPKTCMMFINIPDTWSFTPHGGA